MNVTKTLRNYLLENKGKLIDVQFLYEKLFKDFCSKSSFTKIITRLDSEGAIEKIAKGIFIVHPCNSVDIAIQSFYLGKIDGMFVGEALFNRNAENKTIISNKILGNSKEILNYKIERIDFIITFEIQELILKLELAKGYIEFPFLIANFVAPKEFLTKSVPTFYVDKLKPAMQYVKDHYSHSDALRALSYFGDIDKKEEFKRFMELCRLL